MTYTHISDSLYEVKLKLYIDCYNGNPGAIALDEYANFAVFEGDSGKYLPNLCQSVPRGNPIRVSKTNYNCIKISPNACVDAYEYITTMILPPIKGGYYISFQRCCRNNTIVNIVSPLSTGDNIWTRVNDTTGIGYNSSPEFKNLPPNFLCTNAPLIFDHSATDADGDSLVYEFFLPYTGATFSDPRPECNEYEEAPFSQITFESGYNPNNAIPSSPTVNLNRNTGLLQLTPTLQGQFVVGILVKEYRNGVLIGDTKRDYQFNVQNCVFETTSAFVNPSVNCNREVFFTNNSQNADSYFWTFGDSTTLNDTSTLKNGYYKYPTAGTFEVKLIAAKGNCVDSLKKKVTVFDRIEFNLPEDIFLCESQSLSIFPDTFYQTASYLWNDGSTDSFLIVNGSGEYWLNITLGNCNTYDTIQIENDNSVVDLLPDSLKCNPNTNQLEAWLRLQGGFNTINWKSEPANLVDNDYRDSILYINMNGKYIVYGLNKNNCPYEREVDIKETDLTRIFQFPNVFTPNGDLINDYFPDKYPPFNFKIQIFNRWGIQIFESENEAWNGGNFPDGVYYFFIQMEACGSNQKSHGVLKLIH
ncbi:MAG: gliding motility-associated C-terminal domain-containing protein [Bacteroidia bacterium]